MTRTRNRRQSTLTFLAEQLVAVEQEVVRFRRKTQSDEAGAERQRSLEARRLALVEAVRQFDPELDIDAIAGVTDVAGGADDASNEGVEGGGHG